jgi:hypothetical protein
MAVVALDNFLSVHLNDLKAVGVVGIVVGVVGVVGMYHKYSRID